MGKPKKSSRKKTSKDLTVKAANAVKGGKSGEDKNKYLVYKLNDIIIT